MQFMAPNQLEENLAMDLTYSKGQVLSSMNSKAHNLASKAFIENITKNLGDPSLFSGTAKVEKQVIRILGHLFDLPTSGTGALLTGGSEANITALWAIRNKRRGKFRLTDPLEIVAPESVHISFDKAADLLGLKLVKVPITPKYQINLKLAEDAITKNTIAIIGVAGTTAFGTIDPLIDLNTLCLDHQFDMHIDAAFGGLVFPFLPQSKETHFLSFDLKAVASITVDIHKMGHVPIPGGGLLWRNTSYPKAIQFTLPYLAGMPKQSTITGTRSGASTIAFLSLWNEIGFEGYQEIVNSCVKNTLFLAKELEKRGLIIPIEPSINILGAKTPREFPLDVPKLHKKLWQKGWTTSIVNGCLRFVIMPPTRKSKLEELLLLLDQLIDQQ